LKLQAKWLSKKYSTIKISGLIEDQQTCLKGFPGCPAAIFRYYIDHRGKVYPCCMAPSTTIGDLSHEKFEKIVQKNLSLSGYQNNLRCNCQAVR
jgi:MoaA/NifB/PqqE/SkfB family radical SAM enzyme